MRIILYKRYVDDINIIARIDLTNERDDRGLEVKDKKRKERLNELILYRR